MKSLHYWTVVVLLVSSLALIRIRGGSEKVPEGVSLDRLPVTIDNLSSTDLPISEDALAILGKGKFLNRIYQATAVSRGVSSLDANGLDKVNSRVEETATGRAHSASPVFLFIGYFPTQRSGQSIHSPQNCLPGSGWTFESKDRITVPGSNGNNWRVGDYLVSDGAHRDEVLYWYFSHGHVDANEYMAKWHLIRDSILLRRTDAALIRVVTPVGQGESRESARHRVVEFAGSLNSILPPYIPD